MMIDKEGKLRIIDFDRDDFGDPWEEFNRIVWCAQAAPAFACGMVDGYFKYDVPIEFWQLLALYICSNTLSSLPWAVSFGESEIKTMINQYNEILAWYENMTRVIPTWYISNSCESNLKRGILNENKAVELYNGYRSSDIFDNNGKIDMIIDGGQTMISMIFKIAISTTQYTIKLLITTCLIFS